ncbi:hypothetical protein T8K17_13550 [Thalassobaculum sp. OXR-137]|uniref:hypothetical protein n=1 Tax=Thalassobaculum sp. OXR-137 TaxID=3100173 RepID=UPI002AC922E7|nr:hypothetical protein [Thalassobaculum sp. OXR-137]WPZ32267.1 hypothetical protein T8K17_13550 [Thalassobaculum sp. OXR-137]
MDAASYRLSETLAKRAMRSLRQTGIHAPEYFETSGFLTRVESMEDLVVLLDVMHNNRFDDFVAELGGLTDADMAALLDAFAEYARFFLTQFPSAEIPIPLSGMLSQYAIGLKLRGIPERKSVLEIGPGSGLLSFFLSKDPGIERYDQVEATESFYLLQSLVNRHVYGHRFIDHAQFDTRSAGLGGIDFDTMRTRHKEILPNYETPVSLGVERSPRAEHFPWWRLEDVAARRYDVVTSNANLTEFNETALRYYAALFVTVLKPTGVFLAQCPGGGKTSGDTAIRALLDVGLRPLVLAARYIGRNPKHPAALPEGKQLVTANLVFVPPGHPLYERASNGEQKLPIFDAEDPLTRGIFGYGRETGAAITRSDLLSAIAERLRGLD